MFIIGVTGGSGSGKSTVADLFARHGGVAIDAVTISEDSKFTQMMLIEAIGSMLEKATLPMEESLVTDFDF